LKKFKSNIGECPKWNRDAFLLDVSDVVDGAWRVEGGTNTSRCPYGVPTTKLSKCKMCMLFLARYCLSQQIKLNTWKGKI